MIAARINSGSLASEAGKAWAGPWEVGGEGGAGAGGAGGGWGVPGKLARIDAGSPSWRSAARMASTAWPRETSDPRLNESVTEGKRPWGCTASAAGQGRGRA